MYCTWKSPQFARFVFLFLMQETFFMVSWNIIYKLMSQLANIYLYIFKDYFFLIVEKVCFKKFLFQEMYSLRYQQYCMQSVFNHGKNTLISRMHAKQHAFHYRFMLCMTNAFSCHEENKMCRPGCRFLSFDCWVGLLKMLQVRWRLKLSVLLFGRGCNNNKAILHLFSWKHT